MHMYSWVLYHKGHSQKGHFQNLRSQNGRIPKRPYLKMAASQNGRFSKRLPLKTAAFQDGRFLNGHSQKGRF